MIDLHQKDKDIEYNESLMAATLGSQEGAFESVRLNFSGDQGHTMRQLISGNSIRRVAVCALSSIKEKRQHLAVNHDKGKITILQLFPILKQADSNRRKLTLTGLSTTSVPFTVLSMSHDPCNEDFLVVWGLKELASLRQKLALRYTGTLEADFASQLDSRLETAIDELRERSEQEIAQYSIYKDGCPGVPELPRCHHHWQTQQ